MKNIGKRTLSVLMAAVMILSLLAVPGWNAKAAEIDGNTLPEELQDLNPAHIKQYDASYFTDPAGMGTTLVEDSDSPLGQAYYHAGLAMGNWLSTAYRNNYGSEKWLVDVSGSTVPIDGQYHFYKYTWTVPADLSADKADIGVYHGGKWIASNQQIAQDAAAYKGETVDFYVSIKIGGDAASTEIYVDQMLLVDQCTGSSCPVCGDELDVTTLPEELRDVDPLHIKQFDATYFTDPEKMGSVLVEDADSPLGKAYYNAGLAMGNWMSTAYRNNYGSEKWLVDVSGSTVPIDGQYHFYKYTWAVPADLSAEKADIGVYHGGKWIASNEKIAQAAAAYKGETVDFYVSIKIGGTAQSTEFYVDQMLLVDQCTGSSCPVCGDELDVTTLPEELRDVNPLHIKQFDATYFTDPEKMGSVLVEDADSPLGQAYYNEGLAMGGWLSTAYRNNYGGEKWLVDVPGNTVPIDGQYHFYKYTWAVPADLSVEKADIGVYHGGKWIASNEKIAQAAVAYQGKTVDFYVSIKIGGTAQSTEFYVDQMLLVTHCEDVDGDFVCNECGESLLNETLPEELQRLDPRHVMQYDISCFSDPEGTGSYAVEDAASPLGKAWYIEGLSMGSWLSLGYRALLGPGSAQNYWPIDIAGSAYPIDGQYHFYKTTWTVPEDLSTEDNWFFVYHSGQWVCYNYQMAEDIESYIGKKVDIYLSMKIDGTFESTQLYVDQMILVDLCENHWDEGTVTQAPTENEDGIKTYTCTLCGATRTESIPKLTPAANWNLVLDGNIGMNFYLNVTADEAASATVDVSVNGETTTKNVADLLVDGAYVLVLELAAAQMTDNVTVTLNKNGQAISKDYSVSAYADYILAGDYADEMKNLVKYMLAYGAASQNYFDYNTENLADAGIEAAPAAVPTTGGSMDVAGKVSGIKLYGATLVHKNKIAVRFYFTGDVAGKIFAVNGETVNAAVKGDQYFVEIADICPQDLDDDITVTVTAGGSTLSVVYAPVDYIIRMYAKGGNVAPLVQALYGYYLAAEAYTS